MEAYIGYKNYLYIIVFIILPSKYIKFRII